MTITGVLHMHSTHSYDGKLSLRELKSFLLGEGVQFACMTEHTDYLTKEKATEFVRECRELSDETFVFVPGFEVPYKKAHVLHIGATEFICDFANATQLQLWRKVSPFVILAHPVRNKFAVDETLLSVIDGVEVWNQQYEGKSVPRTRSVGLLKKLRVKKELLATGGLDFHRLDHWGSPVTKLQVSSLSTESIIEALTHGDYVFGNDNLVVSANETIITNIKIRWQSFASVLIINFGKKLNKLLAQFGLKMPGFLNRFVRSRV